MPHPPNGWTEEDGCAKIINSAFNKIIRLTIISNVRWIGIGNKEGKGFLKIGNEGSRHI